MNPVSRITLSNGVRVLLERMSASKTVALGLWVDVGSRDESPAQGGITHFIEHMLFKGTRRRDLFTLARDVNTLGGNFNAFTTPEQLCLHATVVQNDVEPALTTLAEMLIESVFPEQEIDNERGVILEEIAESEDEPEESVEDRFYRALWPGHPLARPVTGSRQTVERLDRDQMLRFWRHHFSPERLVISVAGGIDRRKILPVVKRLFGALPDAASRNGHRVRPAAKPGVLTESRDLEQIHFAFGTEGPARQTSDRFALAVLNTLYGGGMGSRLSNEIREKRGLAYSIWSGFSAFNDGGSFMIRGSVAPENLPAVFEVSMKELRSLMKKSPTEQEVKAAKDQCIRSFLLSQDVASVRMTRLGEDEMADMETLPATTVVRRLQAITPKSITEVAKKTLEGKRIAAALIGPVNGHAKLFRNVRA